MTEIEYLKAQRKLFDARISTIEPLGHRGLAADELAVLMKPAIEWICGTAEGRAWDATAKGAFHVLEDIIPEWVEMKKRESARETFAAGDGSPADREAHDLKIGPYADEQPWIQWTGGAQPVEGDVRVDVEFRHGGREMFRAARVWAWQQAGAAYDIVAYRVCKV